MKNVGIRRKSIHCKTLKLAGSRIPYDTEKCVSDEVWSSANLSDSDDLESTIAKVLVPCVNF